MSSQKYNPKVDLYVEKIDDFAKPVFAHLRALIHATCPEVIEKIKYAC